MQSSSISGPSDRATGSRNGGGPLAAYMHRVARQAAVRRARAGDEHLVAEARSRVMERARERDEDGGGGGDHSNAEVRRGTRAYGRARERDEEWRVGDVDGTEVTAAVSALRARVDGAYAEERDRAAADGGAFGNGGREGAGRVEAGEREDEMLFLLGADIEANIEGGDLVARYERAERHAERVLECWALVSTDIFDGWGVFERDLLYLLMLEIRSGFSLGPEGALPTAYIERLREILRIRRRSRSSAVYQDSLRGPGYAAAFANFVNAPEAYGYGEGHRDRGREGDARRSAAHEAEEVRARQRRYSRVAQEEDVEDEELWRPVTETERRVAASRSRSQVRRPEGSRARHQAPPVTLKLQLTIPLCIHDGVDRLAGSGYVALCSEKKEFNGFHWRVKVHVSDSSFTGAAVENPFAHLEAGVTRFVAVFLECVGPRSDAGQGSANDSPWSAGEMKFIVAVTGPEGESEREFSHIFSGVGSSSHDWGGKGFDVGRGEAKVVVTVEVPKTVISEEKVMMKTGREGTGLVCQACQQGNIGEWKALSNCGHSFCTGCADGMVGTGPGQGHGRCGVCNRSATTSMRVFI